MKTLAVLSNWFNKTARNFTLIMLVLMPAVALLFSDTSMTPGFNFVQITAVLCYSAISAVSIIVSKAIKAGAVIKYLVNFLINNVGLLLVINVFVLGAANPAQKTMILGTSEVVFIVLQLAVWGISFAYRRIFKIDTHEKPVYEKQFENLKNNNK